MRKLVSVFSVALAFFVSTIAGAFVSEESAITKAAGKTTLQSSQEGTQGYALSSLDEEIVVKQHGGRGGRRGGHRSA